MDFDTLLDLIEEDQSIILDDDNAQFIFEHFDPEADD